MQQTELAARLEFAKVRRSSLTVYSAATRLDGLAAAIDLLTDPATLGISHSEFIRNAAGAFGDAIESFSGVLRVKHSKFTWQFCQRLWWRDQPLLFN